MLVALLAAPAQAEHSRAAHARAELKALRSKIAQVRQQITAGSQQRSALAQALADAQHQIDAARQRLDTLEASITEHKRRIAQLRAARDAQQAHLKNERAHLRKQVRAAYISGHINRMRLLLSGKSPAKIGRMLVYYQYFTKAQTAQINRLKATLAKLAARQQALTAEQSALTAQRASRAATLDKLQAGRKQQQATIAALDSRLATKKSSLKGMRADQARIKKLLHSLQKQLSNLPPVTPHTPFSQLKGRLLAPVAGPVIAGFGRRKAGGPLHWQGEWLAATPGTPIRAVATGRVVYIGYMKRYGLIVILDHGHDYYTLYGHAKSSYVDVGDTVRAGQPIATAGHSGGHARAGAYFEIRHGATPLDPASWLAR
jgi:septal ring factor EnvC (AmiA/AmiB activator)